MGLYIDLALKISVSNAFEGEQEFGMISEWPNHADERGGWRMRMPSPVAAPSTRCAASSVTGMPVSLLLLGGQKNALRCLRKEALGLVRPQGASGARPVVRRHPGVPRIGDPAGGLPKMRQGEERTTRLPFRQPAVDETIRLPRWSALPVGHDPGRGQRAASGLAYSQGVGQALHARATGACRQARLKGDRH